MRSTLNVLALLVLASFFLVAGPIGCKSADKGGDQATEAQCACPQGKEGETVWCQKCEAGYVDKEKVSCQGCFKHKSGDGPECTSCDKS